MIKALIREFPVTDILDDMTEEKIRRYAYTKDEVDALIAEAVAEARRRLTEVDALLVIEGDLLVGLVSRMDLVKALRLNSIA